MVDGVIVTKVLVMRAGFFQAVPLGQMLRNAFKQVSVEGATFEAGHGKLGIAVLLSGFQLANGESTHTGVEVKMPLACQARLTGTQTRQEAFMR